MDPKPGSLAWSDWPARRSPLRAIIAATAIGVTVALVMVMDPLLGVVGALLLIGATAEELLPSKYELSESGVRIGRALWSREVTWSKLRGWAPAPDGFVLQGAGSHPILRRRRTIRLHCPNQQEAVAALLNRYLP
jgi:hypothetical protein